MHTVMNRYRAWSVEADFCSEFYYDYITCLIYNQINEKYSLKGHTSCFFFFYFHNHSEYRLGLNQGPIQDMDLELCPLSV